MMEPFVGWLQMRWEMRKFMLPEQKHLWDDPNIDFPEGTPIFKLFHWIFFGNRNFHFSKKEREFLKKYPPKKYAKLHNDYVNKMKYLDEEMDSGEIMDFSDYTLVKEEKRFRIDYMINH